MFIIFNLQETHSDYAYALFKGEPSASKASFVYLESNSYFFQSQISGVGGVASCSVYQAFCVFTQLNIQSQSFHLTILKNCHV